MMKFFFPFFFLPLPLGNFSLEEREFLCVFQKDLLSSSDKYNIGLVKGVSLSKNPVSCILFLFLLLRALLCLTGG